jgi:hypothetical protein
MLADLYVEPGEFYTIFAIGTQRASQLSKLQSEGMVRFQIRRDLTVDDVHNDLPTADVASLAFVPFARRIAASAVTTQAFAAVKITGTGASATTTTRDWTNSAIEVRSALINTVFTDALGNGWTKTGAMLPTHAISLPAGTYTFSQDAATACNTIVPQGQITIAAGTRTEIFVLNTEGCVAAGNVLGKLVTFPAVFGSAASTGNGPSVATVSAREARDVPFYSAGSAVSSSMALLVSALLAALALAW